MTRTLRLPAALALVGMTALISACGSSTRAHTGGNDAATNHGEAVKFAMCMRSNGVSEFPDPNASGTLTLDGVVNGSSLDPNAPAFKQALGACKDLQPAGFVGHTRTAQEQENALKFAQCIRDNGVQDFPDPTPDSPLIDTTRMPGNPDGQRIPGLREAMAKCRDFAANAGAVGAR